MMIILAICVFAVAFVGIEARSPTGAACHPVMCRMYCPFGWDQDSNGCDICKCAPYRYCSPNMCAMYCEHGLKTDDNGCDVCSCRNTRKFCYGDKPCPPGQCKKFCLSGFKRDENGCTICECRSDVEVVKPGSCPAEPSYGRVSCTKELNLNDCRGDQDCSGDRKCCRDPCRKKCMDPA